MKHREKESPDNRCVQCHMPQATTEVEHVAFTHHRIGKQFQPPQDGLRLAGELRPVLTLPALSEVDRKRALGLGYLEVANRSPDQAMGQEYAKKSLDLLRSVRAAGMRDSLSDAGLVFIYNPNNSALFLKKVLYGPLMSCELSMTMF